jgi:hypothetical protein
MYQVQTQLTHRSGLAKDHASNNFTFQVADAGVMTLSAALEIAQAVSLFYTDAASGGNTIGRYLSDELSRTADACEARVYWKAADGSLPPVGNWGPPVLVLPFTLPVAADPQPLPGEVALVLSLRSADAIQTGSTRGRLFIGPLNLSTDAGGATEPSRPASAFRADVAARAVDLSARTTQMSSSTDWGVWGKLGFRRFNTAVIDNAWDTQRRRGVLPSQTSTTLIV